MIFQKRTDFLPSSSGNALGSSVRFELTREFHIDSIFIRLTFTPTAVMATDNADGIYKLPNPTFAIKAASSGHAGRLAAFGALRVGQFE